MRNRFEDPDYYLLNNTTEQLATILKKLPDTYRETFELSRLSHHTNAQIAQKLGVSIKTVEYRITKSLKILAGLLKDYDL
jgi:RNA polymerase sigma-70 factor (ECF subfamily)